jgi:hypothetical protein
MKKKLYSTFAMLGLFVTMAVVTVQAQSRGKLEITIPFDFHVGSKTLPAGEYSVKQLTQNSMLIKSANGEMIAIAQTPRAVQAGPNEKTAQERLVFQQYGKQYFLSQVWMVRGSDGRELNKSDAEREAAKERNLANGGEKPRKVEVAARAR